MASLFDTSTSRHLENEPPVRRVNISFPCPKKTEVMWWSQTKILTEANLHKQFNFTVIPLFEYVPFKKKTFSICVIAILTNLKHWNLNFVRKSVLEMSYYSKKNVYIWATVHWKGLLVVLVLSINEKCNCCITKPF